MAGIVKVYSENDVFQKMAALSTNRRKRHQARQCLVEGVKPINLALANHWHFAGWIYAMDSDLSDWAKDTMAQAAAETRYEMAPHLMEALSDKEETSELLAVVSTQSDKVDRIRIDCNPLLVVLDQPQSPGNLGSIVRSCDAFKVGGIAVAGHSADIYDPQTIRASLGTLFSTPTVRMESFEGLWRWLDSLRATIPALAVVGTSAKADADLREVDLTKPTVLVFGNETRGMSWNLRQACDTIARIPIHGSASSLNLASAASIVLYEADRQRRTHSVTGP